ncbi:MAG: MBL fold metallo-hydrolase [Halanaeroarchaeum sp.]
MELRPTVHSYDVPWGWGDVEEALSVHVLETDAATVLFGTGDEGTAEDVVAIAEDHDVDVVVAEHGDIDHFGGIPFLTDALDVTVAIPAGDTRFLEEHGIGWDVELEAGETHWGVRTIGVPGHTPDNLAYLVDDVLVAGDTVCGSDSAFAMEGDWPGALAPLADQLNFDTDEMLESIAFLLEEEFSMVLVSHGSNVTEDGHGEVERLVDALGE